ncbi:MAG TPA: glycoside hydrolase, partial [Chitinophagaceae bacterium]|nr:glycoside hydrolase [Chitinophagaceae bacterium]
MKYIFVILYSIWTCFGANAQTRQIKIYPLKTFQTIDHFAASDAWSGNYVGQYWDLTQKEQVAKWLFSQNMDGTGNPVGIGLSSWRVNLGAGSLDQDSAAIVPIQRRTESFLTNDGKSYDWGKCSGQQYFMQKAAEYGCNDFLLFSNSPPLPFTVNERGWPPFTGNANIRPEGYELFAKYMADVAKYFIVVKGWNIRFISPIN